MRSAPAPGLGPAVAEHRDTPGEALRTALLVAAVVLAFDVVMSLSDGDGLIPSPTILVIAVIAAGVRGLHTLRNAATAGPGWLHIRRIKGGSWVRTDQLVEVRAGGITEVILRLRDRDGRRLSIPWSEVATTPALVARLLKDVRTSVAGGADLDARSASILLADRR